MNELKKIGGAILINGVKSITLGAGMIVLSTLVGSGLSGLQDLTLDKLIK